MLYIFTTKSDYSILNTLSHSSKELIDKIRIFYYSDLQIINHRIFSKGKELGLVGEKILLRDPSNELSKDYTPIFQFILQLYKNQSDIYEEKFLTKYAEFEDKIVQIAMYSEFFKKIKIPQFIYPIKIETHDEQQPLPIMCKERKGCRNRGNKMIRDKTSFLNFSFSEKHFLQEFIDFDRDIRIVFLNRKFISAVTRKRNEQGILKLKEDISDQIPSNIIIELENLLSCTGLDFVGIDLLQKESDFYFLEANRSPQYKGSEKITGAPIGELLLKTLLV